MNSPLTGDTIFRTVGRGFVSGTGPVVRPLGDGVDLVYGFASETIEVHLPNGDVVFFATDSVAQAHPFSANNTFRNQDSGGDDLERLSISVPRIDGVPLTYLRYAFFFGDSPVSVGKSVTETFFFGLPTANMPTAGSASYEMGLNGTLNGNGNNYALIYESSGTLGVDFASGDITTMLHFIGTDSSDDSIFDFGIVNGSGSITAGGPGFSGSFDTGTSWLEGAFFGPNADEVGYQFFIDAPTFEASGYAWGVQD